MRRKKKDLHIDHIIDYLFDMIATLEPYEYHRSKYGSVYIKFNNADIGSLRISDHKGRNKYGYRWNLRLDIDEKKVYNNKNGYKQYYYPLSGFMRMCQHMTNYNNKIKKRQEKEQ